MVDSAVGGERDRFAVGEVHKETPPSKRVCDVFFSVVPVDSAEIFQARRKVGKQRRQRNFGGPRPVGSG